MRETLKALRQMEKRPRELACMVEAKQKDEAMFRLVAGLATYPGVRQVDEATLDVRP